MTQPFRKIFRTKHTLPVLLALVFALPLAAQEYIAKVEHYGVEQGLSHREVNHIYQDSRGFVWIGTPNGLNRFDGYSFRLYTKEKDGLLFNDVQCISEDAEGWLWLVGPYYIDAICLFHPERGEVLSFEQKFGRGYPAFNNKNPISNILRTDDQALWISPGSSKTLYRYHPATGLQAIPLVEIDYFNPVFSSPSKTIWGGASNYSIVELDLQGKVLQRIEQTSLYGEWAISENGILAIDMRREKGWRFRLFDLNGLQKPLNKAVFSRYRDPYPALIFPFENEGLMVVHDHLVDPVGSVLASWEFPQHDRNNFLWRAFMQDREGRIWLGDDFGFYILQIKKNRFQRYFYQKGVKPGEGNSFRGILATPEKLYGNLEKSSLYELDLRSGQSRSLPFVSSGWGHFALAWGNNGELLSGAPGLFYRLRAGAERGESITTGQVSAWAICQDRSGRYWIGSDGKGLYTCPSDAKAAEPYTQYNAFDALGEAFIVHIEQTMSGSLWVCANNGFYKIDLQKGVMARYWSGGTGEYYLPADNFYHFHLDADGVFWFGTTSGLLRTSSKTDAGGDQAPAWDTRLGKVFTRADGLSNDVIYAVYEDGQDRLWMSTNHGIIRFEKKTGLSKTYLTVDGITDPEFNRTAHFHAKNGAIYFGSLNGITAFRPADFYERQDSLSNRPLEITAFQQFDGKTNRLIDRTSEILHSREIILRPDDRFFNLELALLSYEEAHQIQYAWKIEGLDKDWHYQKERHLNYGGLPYGKYTLRIKAQAADGQWSGRELAITIRALRPWYLQAWFLILAAVLAGGGIFVYIRWRSRQLIVEQKRLEGLVAKATERIEKQAKELRHLDEVKSRFFANVSHELRTPLSLLLGPIGSVLKRNNQDNQDFTLLKLAQMHGRQLLQLVNQILDLSKLESGKLELQESPTLLHPLLRRIVAAFESHAERKGIQFVFRYRTEKNLCLLLDALKLETILNNLLSNALKFTPEGGEIEVVADNLAHAMRIAVNDSGRGVHPDDLVKIFDRFYQSGQPDAPTEGGTGIGLALSRELIELMGGKIWAESAGLNRGSRFFIEFPLHEVLGKTAAAPEEEPINAVDAEAVPALERLSQQEARAGTLLVVEDNVSLRDYLQLILSADYRILTAENGQEALHLMDTLHQARTLPDLIISDIMMPVMDGFQLLERLKKDPHFRPIPVVMLTARADAQDKLRALRIGVDDYLLKPFEEEELRVRIDTLLERYRERRQLPSETLHEEIPPEHGENESAWLAELESLVSAEVQNDLLSVAWIADRMHLSERQFQRRLKQLTGLSPSAYLNEVRLQEARRLLEQGKVHSVKELAWAMSFRNEKYFAQIFRERFGKNPSELLR